VESESAFRHSRRRNLTPVIGRRCFSSSLVTRSGQNLAASGFLEVRRLVTSHVHSHLFESIEPPINSCSRRGRFRCSSRLGEGWLQTPFRQVRDVNGSGRLPPLRCRCKMQIAETKFSSGCLCKCDAKLHLELGKSRLC
jgi:hypothetical protein